MNQLKQQREYLNTLYNQFLVTPCCQKFYTPNQIKLNDNKCLKCNNDLKLSFSLFGFLFFSKN
jgi:hypothetical protein